MTQKGIGLKLQSLVEEDGRSSNLHLFWLQSELTDVELLETRSSERTVTLQVPHFSQTSLRTSTRIPAGHSLLVVPLRRNAQGHLMMCLVTPRVLTAEGLK
jgi:hypothetical protein